MPQVEFAILVIHLALFCIRCKRYFGYVKGSTPDGCFVIVYS